jgi:hypothetical protein
MEWPGRCSRCKELIDDWADAGSFNGHWIHKACWNEAPMGGSGARAAAAELSSPVERGRELDWPMLFYLLLFHFGLGAAIAGWLMLTQVNSNETTAMIVFVAGIVVPLIGVIGCAFNIVSRRRIEIIRQTLDLQGGWKPGR